MSVAVVFDDIDVRVKRQSVVALDRAGVTHWMRRPYAAQDSWMPSLQAYPAAIIAVKIAPLPQLRGIKITGVSVQRETGRSVRRIRHGNE